MERATQERLVGATLLIVAGVILIPWLLDGSMTGTGVSQQELVLPGGSDNGNETRRISLEVPRHDASSANGSPRELDTRTVREASSETSAVSLPAPEARKTVTTSPPETRDTSTTQAPARFAKPMPDSTAAKTPTKPAAAPTTTRKPPPQETAPATTEVASTTTSRKPPAASPSNVTKPVASAPANSTTDTLARSPAVTAATNAPEAAKEQAWAVQVGSFASQENAERLAERLRGKSYKAFVMRNVIDGRVRFRVRVGPVSQRNEADLLATALREDRQPARVLSHP